jgi:hypothetical protein
MNFAPTLASRDPLSPSGQPGVCGVMFTSTIIITVTTSLVRPVVFA